MRNPWCKRPASSLAKVSDCWTPSKRVKRVRSLRLQRQRASTLYRTSPRKRFRRLFCAATKLFMCTLPLQYALRPVAASRSAGRLRCRDRACIAQRECRRAKCKQKKRSATRPEFRELIVLTSKDGVLEVRLTAGKAGNARHGSDTG